MNRPFSPPWPPRLAALTATFALVACGGGGDGGGTPMPPGGNADPVAAFSAPDSVVAQSAW